MTTAVLECMYAYKCMNAVLTIHFPTSSAIRRPSPFARCAFYFIMLSGVVRWQSLVPRLHRQQELCWEIVGKNGSRRKRIFHQTSGWASTFIKGRSRANRAGVEAFHLAILFTKLFDRLWRNRKMLLPESCLLNNHS